MEKNKLWTRDFTIITLGTVVSMLGNAVSGFAIGIMVLDYTDSVFLYALFMIVYNLPKLGMPILAGPYLDTFSRKKVIYTLDFISAGLFTMSFFLLQFDLFNYPAFLVLAFIIGSIDSIYQVAYDSLYPNLVSAGNMTKAYSISSMIYPISAIMVPVAAWVYENYSLTPLFLFNAVTFLIAAIFETQIKAPETHLQKIHEENTDSISALSRVKSGFSNFGKTFKEGIDYIFGEKGLLIITAYFFVTMFATSGGDTVILPYFKATEDLGIQLYTYVMGMSVIGRLIGGALHYKFVLPKKARFNIAIAVYFTTTIINAVYLFTSPYLMMLMCLINGIICVTSFNIRISSTQAYVPDTCRARFNGAFLMVTTAGSIAGQLVGGLLGDFLPARAITVGFMVLNMLGVFLIMGIGAKHVKPIYNNDI